jgi:hypothetical protein
MINLICLFFVKTSTCFMNGMFRSQNSQILNLPCARILVSSSKDFACTCVQIVDAWSVFKGIIAKPIFL